MKKGGILNAQLMGSLTALRHGDKFVICDVGLSLPHDAMVVDLALIAGIPSFMQTFKAVLNEIIVEEGILPEPIQQYNSEINQEIKSIIKKQKLSCLPIEDFNEKIKEAKLYIRTAEFAPCSNIILFSASGVPCLAEPMNVVCENI